jgi:hypothetical protein
VQQFWATVLLPRQAAIAALLARRQPLLEEAGLGSMGGVLMQWQVAELMRRLYLDFQQSIEYTSRAKKLDRLNSSQRSAKTRGWYMTYLHRSFGGEVVVKVLLAVGAFDEDLAASMREVRQEITAEGPRPAVSPRTRAQAASARAAVQKARRADRSARQNWSHSPPRKVHSTASSSSEWPQQQPPPWRQSPLWRQSLPGDRCVQCSWRSKDTAMCVRCTAPLCTWHRYDADAVTCKDANQCMARRRLWADHPGVLPVPRDTPLPDVAACPAGQAHWKLQRKSYDLAQQVQAQRPQPGHTFADRVVQRWVHKKREAGFSSHAEPAR